MTQASKEYATALFTLALEEDILGELVESVDAAEKVFLESPGYIELLASPAVPMEERQNAIGEAMDGRLHEYVVSTIRLLCKKGRIREIFGFTEEFRKLADAATGVSDAEIVSAVPLTADELARLKDQLEKKLGHAVRMTPRVDEGLLGGVLVRADGRIMDGTLRRQLAELRDALK